MTVLICSALAAPAGAQDSPEAWLIPFAIGFRPPVSGFNTEFSSHGLPQARINHFGWGLELRTLTGGFLVGPLFFRTWDDVENDSFKLRTDATAIMCEVGFKIAPVSFLSIVPMVAIGGLNQSFNIREKTGTLELDSLLGFPGRSVSLTPGMKLTGLAALEIGAAFNTGSGRVGLALRGGYLYSPLELNWHTAGGDPITETPDMRLGGPFLSAGLLFMPEAEVTSSIQN
jgi:hypothetical protein